MMNEPHTEIGPRQKMSDEILANKVAEAKNEEGAHPTVSENDVDEQNFPEADLTGNPNSVGPEILDNAHGALLQKQTDDAPPEKLADSLPAEKAIDGTASEKAIDDTPLEKQPDDQVAESMTQMETGTEQSGSNDIKTRKENEAVPMSLENITGPVETDTKECQPEDMQYKTPLKEEDVGVEQSRHIGGSNQSFRFEPYLDGNDSGTDEEQAAFMKELEIFHQENNLEFKPPKFYGVGLNCLKLWRVVTRLGGYDRVTLSKLWRQVGESFNPPKTCTTISWSFRIFYEKALLEYEKHKIQTGELKFSTTNTPGSTSADNQVSGHQALGSGRARRDAAARAMQGWHTQWLLDEEGGDPIIKDKRDRQLKSIATLKKRKASSLEHAVKAAKADKSQDDVVVVDVGTPAEWVKINVLRTKERFEVYALVPGLLREEVQVQSDPAGRLIISGEPEQRDNPWGVTPFKKVVTLPARIDPHQTSAVVTLHGQLLVRAPLEEPGV